MRSLSDTFGFYTIKVTAIVIVTLLYVFFGSTASIVIDKIIPYKDPKKMSTPSLVIHIALFFSLIALIFYALRIQLKHTPQFLDGLYGFDHMQLTEASGGIVISFIMFSFHDNVKNWILELRNRIPF